MTIKYSNRRSSSKSKYTLDDRSLKIKIFILVILMLTLTVNVIPIAAVSKPGDAYNDPGFQTASTLIFKAEADARVEESNPTTNAGTSDYLEVISENNRSIESYVRFTVSGISGVIQDARLRVYSTTETSMNGPAVYPADNNWTETGITWNNRPAPTTGVIFNLGTATASTWAEYNVTAYVTGNGTFSFVLLPDSTNGVTFDSREGASPPQLVLTFASELRSEGFRFISSAAA